MIHGREHVPIFIEALIVVIPAMTLEKEQNVEWVRKNVKPLKM
jgi:hypothetical protein